MARSRNPKNHLFTDSEIRNFGKTALDYASITSEFLGEIASIVNLGPTFEMIVDAGQTDPADNPASKICMMTAGILQRRYGDLKGVDDRMLELIGAKSGATTFSEQQLSRSRAIDDLSISISVGEIAWCGSVYPSAHEAAVGGGKFFLELWETCADECDATIFLYYEQDFPDTESTLLFVEMAKSFVDQFPQLWGNSVSEHVDSTQIESRIRLEMVAMLNRVEQQKLLPHDAQKIKSRSSLPPLNESARKAANFIVLHPGSGGKIVAKNISVSFEHFRRSIVPILKQHGFTNPGGGEGYFPPNQKTSDNSM